MSPHPNDPAADAVLHADGSAEQRAKVDGVSPAELMSNPGAAVQIDATGSLRDQDLAGKDLRELNLAGRDLSGANLRGANLTKMNLEGTDFSNACLEDADLAGANLTGAQLGDASCKVANFTGACLAKAHARRVEMQGANLTRTDLRGLDIQRSDLSNTKLFATQVDGADFARCDLRGAHMAGIRGYKKAEWKNVDIRDIDLHGTYLARRFIADQNYLHEFRSRGTWARISYYGWWLTSDCGRSLTRWGLLTCLLMVAYAKAFSVVPMDYGVYETWLSPIYVSVITMTSLGFGDAIPASVAGQFVAMAEVTTGYVMLGGLLSIFSSRMARRAE